MTNFKSMGLTIGEINVIILSKSQVYFYLDITGPGFPMGFCLWQQWNLYKRRNIWTYLLKSYIKRTLLTYKNFNEIYSKMNILVGKSDPKLCFKFFNDLDELLLNTISEEIILNQYIKHNQHVFSAHICLQNNFKDSKDFTKPYIFIMTLARRHHFLTSNNHKIKIRWLTRLAN